MQIINSMSSFVMSLVSPDKMLGHQFLLKFQSQQERGKVFPFQLHFKVQILTQQLCFRVTVPLCCLFLLIEANRGVTDFLWQFLSVQEKDVPRL